MSASVADLLNGPFASLPDLIAAHARARPDAEALIDGGARWSYRDLDRFADRVAAALQRDGVGGGVVAFCGRTSAEYVGLFIGALRAGAAASPLSPAGARDSIQAMIADSAAGAVFADEDGRKVCEGGPAPLIGMRADEIETWLGETQAPAPVAIDPGAPFNIIYSSGTTGAPKGIVQPHIMRWGHVKRGLTLEYGPDATAIISTPLYSNTTLVSLIPTLGLGGRAVLMARFSVEGFLQLAQEHRATHAMLVPVQYMRLMEHPAFDRYDLSAFRMKTCTSAPFSAALKADILARWPGELIEIFGMTEGGGVTMLRARQHPDKLGTVGRPVEGHDIRLLKEDGSFAGPGETGEIVGHSGAMMTGYHNRPEQTAAAEWHDETGKRFIRTGDIGRFDADGFLTLLDRKKDMIISGGFNLYPSDLEQVLAGHEAVAEAAVVGVPSRKWGETPVAFVVLRPGAALEPPALLEWVNAKVGKMQRLADLKLMAALPRSTIGKVLKRELAARYDGDAP